MAISFSCSSSTKLAWMLALLLFLATMLPGHGQSASGFVSIDCGLTSGSYNDITTKIMYHSDRGFVEGGLSYKISTDFMANATNQQQKTLRSFPDGPRNCYTLPSIEGETFLLRAAFTYGNYDGLNKTHDGSQFLFGLHIGVNFWEMVNLTNWDPSTMIWKELLSIAPSDFVSVCLVNLGSGTPFVSVLELRPLNDSIYSFVSTSVSASYIKRIRFGDVAEYITRYPVDPYDGFWESWSWSYPWLSLNTSNKVFNNGLNVPSAILQKASTVDTNYSFINITVEVDQNLEAKNLQLMFLFHFAEIDGNSPNRTFDIYSAGKLLAKSFSPTKFQVSTYVDSTPAWRNAGVSFSLNKTPSSRLPPLINAFEVYSPVRMDNLTTDAEDVKYMKEVKKHYNLTRTHWNGDPCSPREYSWEGLTCDYSKSNKSNQNPRIVRVDLSTSGLKGELAISFTNMVSLENLDLSHNNLTGVIPELQLMSLKVLNLENNQLDGPISDSILQRYHAGLLDLRLEGNPICSKVKDWYCSNKKKNIPHILLVKVIVPMVLVSLVVVMCISWKSCWKGKSGDHKDYAMYEDETPLHVDVRRYTYAELKLITNDFHSIIGKGGFGIVYHGILENGDEVAVKVLVETSIAESTDFLPEVQTLSKVHHKNLVILQGYCQNKKCLALIYDFMPRGNLQQLLRGEHDYRLDWEQRLHIALDAAQGLEYLHESCSPSIVHRDVKTPNILLNKNLEGIISDFGLSRAFNDAHTHISTVIAGTLGYLDPEYHATFQLTVKTDVYSFGIVLLELVTGRPPVFMDPQAVHLPNWVRQKMAEGSVRDVVDMRLLDDQHDDRSLNNAVDLAMNCLENAAIHRPTMTEVVSRLKACLPTVFRETQYISVASRRHKNDMDTEIPFNNDQGGAGGMSEIGLFSGR